MKVLKDEITFLNGKVYLYVIYIIIIFTS